MSLESAHSYKHSMYLQNHSIIERQYHRTFQPQNHIIIGSPNHWIIEQQNYGIKESVNHRPIEPQNTTLFNLRTVASQNYRLAWIGIDIIDHLVPTILQWAEMYSARRDCPWPLIQAILEHFQGWGIYHWATSSHVSAPKQQRTTYLYPT